MKIIFELVQWERGTVSLDHWDTEEGKDVTFILHEDGRVTHDGEDVELNLPVKLRQMIIGDVNGLG